MAKFLVNKRFPLFVTQSTPIFHIHTHEIARKLDIFWLSLLGKYKWEIGVKEVNQSWKFLSSLVCISKIFSCKHFQVKFLCLIVIHKIIWEKYITQKVTFKSSTLKRLFGMGEKGKLLKSVAQYSIIILKIYYFLNAFSKSEYHVPVH